MIDLLNPAPAWGYGPKPTIARARFVGAAATTFTLLDSQGIKSVTQSTTTSGLFTVTLAEKLPDFTPMVTPVAAHADVHECPVFAIDLAAGTFQFAHYFQATRTGAPAAQTITNGNSPSVTFHIVVVGRGGL